MCMRSKMEKNEGKWGLRCLTRRKPVDSDRVQAEAGHHQLARDLSLFKLIAIGVGSTIGAGIYVIVGAVAREQAGPALAISFLIAGIASALSAFCYAELASRFPSAGSAYHYSYVCLGEGVAWLVGWCLILEFAVGGSTIARGVSPNLALFFGGPENLPFFLARVNIPALDIVIDPCAAALVMIVTALLCVGIKESSMVQAIVTTANVCVMVFVILAGGYLCFKTGWIGYNVSGGYLPYGVNGMLAGSATVFFAYIGFDAVASTAEEVKNPQRDLPWGIGLALAICCFLYMMVSVVIVGLVPYFALNPDTPISSAFASNGMKWAQLIVAAGVVLALCSTLMGSLLPQPRILMVMARDGLLPPIFSDVNKQTQVPIKSTILTGVCAAALAVFMEVSELAGMVSVGTLLAFIIVAISILVLRYVPPDEISLSSSRQKAMDSGLMQFMQDKYGGNRNNLRASEEESDSRHANGMVTSAEHPLLVKDDVPDENKEEHIRRKKAAWNIVFVCLGALILTSSASAVNPPLFIQYMGCFFGGSLFLYGLIMLSWTEQSVCLHDFGHSGGFICPFVPLLPVCSILINTYLLLNLGVSTCLRTSVWLFIGVFIYLFYGRTHSSLRQTCMEARYAVDLQNA